jgi:hypothetical protein
MIDLADGRITVETAATLMSIGRRQVFRLRRAFEVGGPSALVSRKRGRLEQSHAWRNISTNGPGVGSGALPRFRPKAVEKLVERHGLRVGVETLQQWMMADGLWTDRRHKLPSPHQPRRRGNCLGELVRSRVPNTHGL